MTNKKQLEKYLEDSMFTKLLYKHFEKVSLYSLYADGKEIDFTITLPKSYGLVFLKLSNLISILKNVQLNERLFLLVL